jgi:hypothetical protein
MFKIVNTNATAKRAQNCAADGYELAKGEPVLLAVETSKGNKPTWHVFCPTDAACVAAAEKLAASSKLEDKPADKPAGKPDSKKNNKKNAYQFGDERAVTAGAVKEALATLQKRIDEQNKTISGLNNRIESLEKWQKQLAQKSSSKSNPERTPVEADEDGNFVLPAKCLGVTKSTGKECQQTKNRLQANGYCGQHQDQSGDVQDKTENKKELELVTTGSDLLLI